MSSNVIVTANTNSITVNESTSNVTVTSTPSTITVGSTTGVSNIAVRAAISATDAGGDGSFAYNSTTGVFTYTGPNQTEANARIAAAPTQVRAHLSATGNIDYNSSTGVISESLFTQDVAEGTNLYFTDARSRSSISLNTNAASGDGSLSYDVSTGVFTFAPADVPTSTSELSEGSNLYFTNARARGAISATSPLSYNSSTGVLSISEIGDIESVTAGTGLTGGGSTGNVTLNVGSGYGITVNADSIELTNSLVQAQANIAIGNNTTDNLSEGSTNLYFTTARSNVAFDDRLADKTTSNLTEGTNLYFTTARANAALVDYIGTASNAPFSFGGNIAVSGDVIVSGNLDYENVTDLFVRDQKITLNANAATNSNVQIISHRPQNSNVDIRWNEQADRWQFTNDGTTHYNIPVTTSDLAEGTNLYYTNARVRAAITVNDTGGDGSLSLNSGTGVITYTGPSAAETRAHISATGNIDYNSSTGVISESLFTQDVTEGTNLYYTDGRFDTRLATKTTDNLTEGSSNLYFTNARANSVIGTNTTDNLSEGSTNLYFTVARSNVAFDDRLADKTTSDLAEGTNLYYTTARANAAIADYTGTISTGNTISGTTVTATTEAKTNQISPNSGEQITLKDNNKLLFDGKKQQVSYNLGNVVITGSAAPYSAIGNNIYRESVSSSAEFKTLVGANYISGMMLTSFGHGTTSTYKITEGSNVVQVAGLAVQSANGSFAGVAKTDVDIATNFRVGQTFRFNLGSASGDAKHAAMTAYGFSDKAFIQSVANSSVTGGIANVIMSENATQSETLSCVGGVIGYICDTVSNSTTGDRVGIHGTAPTFVHTLNDITGMPGINYTIEGTNNTGANFFEFFDTTSLSSIDANITPSMLTRVSSAAQDYSIIDFESEDDGYFRFKDTLLIGDHATPYSRGTLNDVKGFGINLQWTGEDDDDRYGGTVQPGLLFQSWTDNTLQGSSSSFLQNGGPRILLSTLQGKISNDPVSHAPVDGQELGKYGWWSTSADRAVPGNSLFGVSKNSSTNPPAYITCQAGRDWDVASNVDTETYFVGATAENSGSGSTYLYYRSGEVGIGALGGQKITFGQGSVMGTDVRANSTLQAEWARIESTGITTSGKIEAEQTVLKKYNETVVDLGTTNGDISSSINANNGTIFTVILDGDVTINSIANAVSGTSAMVKLKQDGTGGRTLTSTMKFANGNKTLSSSADAIDVINIVFDGTDYLASLTNGFS